MKSHDLNGNLPEDLLDRSISALRNAPVPDGPGPQATADTLAALRRVAGEDRIPLNPIGSIGLTQRTLAMIFAHKKLAASLTFIVGGLAVWSMLSFFSSVSYAQVAEKIRSAHSMSCTASVTLAGMKEPVKMKMYFQEPGKLRTESDQSVTINDQVAGTMLSLVHGSKQAILVKYKSYGLPSDFITELRGMATDSKSEPIEDKQIGAVKAKGFKITKEAQKASIWVDPKSGLPLRIEMIAPNNVLVTMDDLRFDPALDATLFSLVPPEGYKTMPQVTLPEMTLPANQHTIEEHVVVILRAYAGMTDGNFPTLLSDPSIIVKIAKGDSNGVPDTETLLVATALGTVFGQLFAYEKGTEYDYIPGLKLGDAGKILFWRHDKVSGKYFAVFGDLKIKEVTAREIPPAVPNPVLPTGSMPPSEVVPAVPLPAQRQPVMKFSPIAPTQPAVAPPAKVIEAPLPLPTPVPTAPVTK